MTTEVRRHADPSALAESVAAALIDRLAGIQAEGRVPSIALTGGSVAAIVHRAVATSMDSLDVDWSEVDFWFGDERYVDAWSPDRNALAARRDLLDLIDVDPARVHEMPSLDSGWSLDDAAATYADRVRSGGAGAFDVVMLGMGPDGHVASLFPGHAALDEEGITVAVPDSPKPPPERISLTFGALNRTAAVWFLVTGADKAPAVAQALAGGDPHEIPARGVSAAETLWWLDDAAASGL